MLGVLLATALSLTTPEEAVALLAADAPRPAPDVVAKAKGLIEAAAKKEPGNPRWTYGRGLALLFSGKGIEGRDLLEQAAKAEPNRSDYQYAYGAAVFQTINEVGMLGKMSASPKGKAALEKAIALDPGNARAHQALFYFYMEAPAFAGGSHDKAREQAQTILALPGGVGAFRGQMLLAQLAAKNEDWAAMSKAYLAAETAGGTGASLSAALSAHALSLLRAKKDPAAALSVIERLAKIAKPEDTAPYVLRAEAKSALGDCTTAVENYLRVLERQPEAKNSRFNLAACLEKLGRRSEAATQYAEFAKRFPEDERAAKAQREAAKLKKGG